MSLDVRSQIVSFAKWGVAHTALIHYEEIRPMPLTAKLPLTTDCSGWVTLCYWLAGAADPNGQGFSGFGFTGTLLSHGQRIPLSHVLPGDVIVYGGGTGEHTALIVEAGDDPLTVSHGQESEPAYVRVSQDGRLPQTYLRFATNSRFPDPPKPVPAPLPSHTFPTAKDVSDAHLVALKNGAQARKAIANGWHLWWWAAPGKWTAQVGGKPTSVALFANRAWDTKAT